jgi:hypothetical protein
MSWRVNAGILGAQRNAWHDNHMSPDLQETPRQPAAHRRTELGRDLASVTESHQQDHAGNLM